MSDTDSAPVAQAVHDLGTALWFGGSVMGVAGVGAAATAYAAYSGRQIGEAAEAAAARGEQLEVVDATTPTEKTPSELATWQRRQRVAQFLVPATSGALVVLNSYLVQQYRPAATLRGLLRGLLPS